MVAKATFKFDKDKVLNVPIDRVVPNGWNPKEEGTREYQKVLDSVRAKGLRGTIVVREHPHTAGYYEILDGQQRYTAAKELNYKDINVYNEGQVEEKDAKELTIWYQQQVPFNRITEAYLVTQMVEEFGLEDVVLPYSEAEIAEFKELADFNFADYEQDGKKEDAQGLVNFSLKLTKEQHSLVKEALLEYGKDHECSESEALVDLLTGETNASIN